MDGPATSGDDKVINIEDYRYDPHVSDELVCISCRHRGMHCWPVDVYLKNLECPQCHRTGTLVGTGCPRTYNDMMEAPGDAEA